MKFAASNHSGIKFAGGDLVAGPISTLFIVDFDGTVAPEDTVDALFEQFADDEWRSVEEDWVHGKINSQQCMSAQIALVRGDRTSLEEFLHSVPVDPAFHDFVSYVRPFADIAVVSDGVDYPIRHALRQFDPPIPTYANALEFCPRGLDISFPHADPLCKVGSGVCKCAVARRVRDDRPLQTILIGDGRSDFCVAHAAGFVFAKGSLLRYCEAENIAHAAFETFADVLSVIRSWHADEDEEASRENECPVAG